MKIPVPDAAVAEYAARIRAGISLGTLFPARMSECDFTDDQRRLIRQARSDRKASQKSVHPDAAHLSPNGKPVMEPKRPTPSSLKTTKPKALTKLQKMLYLQAGRCFFCGEALKEEDASIEHLNPKSRGGTSAEDNEVVCHSSLNETFGALDLKRKFEFVLKSAGKFACPRK